MKNNENNFTQLEKAQALELPKREEVLVRSFSVQQFWKESRSLLKDAWSEWETIEKNKLFVPDESLISKKLRDAVNMAWDNPKKENQVKDLLEEVSPGVFQFQFFDPEKINELRSYLDQIDKAQIPLRPPYGIVLNRKGAMLDRRSEGYLAAPSFQNFYQKMLDKYMRPIGRLLFPEIVGFDTQTFGFSIQYQAGMDTSLRMHTDASAVTLNVNLNLPNELFTGSEVDFHDYTTGDRNRVTFKPGVAMIHRGNIAHEAQPITSGERTNFVLWLYGDRMIIPRNLDVATELTPEERWSTPIADYDDHAPF